MKLMKIQIEKKANYRSLIWYLYPYPYPLSNYQLHHYPNLLMMFEQMDLGQIRLLLTIDLVIVDPISMLVSLKPREQKAMN